MAARVSPRVEVDDQHRYMNWVKPRAENGTEMIRRLLEDER